MDAKPKEQAKATLKREEEQIKKGDQQTRSPHTKKNNKGQSPKKPYAAEA